MEKGKYKVSTRRQHLGDFAPEEQERDVYIPCTIFRPSASKGREKGKRDSRERVYYRAKWINDTQDIPSLSLEFPKFA